MTRLASPRDGMGYCPVCPVTLANVGCRVNVTLQPGGSRRVLHSHLYRLVYGLGMLMLLAGVQPGDWSVTDETAVDLERAPSAAATRYHDPRGARQYRYDETEVDLATPLPAPAPATPPAVSNPAPDAIPEALPAAEEELPR